MYRKAKKLVSLIFAAVLIIQLIPAASAAGLGEFQLSGKGYTFSDVKETAWYSGVASDVADLGLMVGVSATEFDPTGDVSVIQIITIGVHIYEQYHNLPYTMNTPADKPWYTPFVEKAESYGILPDYLRDYKATATRAQVAKYFAFLLSEDLEPINEVNYIPDVNFGYSCYDPVLALYRAGVLTGSDDEQNFLPHTSITRSELAAILVRLVIPSERESFSLVKEESPIKKILLIPGHGNGSPGAVSTVNGINYIEEEETRKIVYGMQEYLAQYGDVIQADIYMPEHNAYDDCYDGTYVNYADVSSYDYVLSIHLNAYSLDQGNGIVKGCEAYLATSNDVYDMEQLILENLEEIGFPIRQIVNTSRWLVSETFSRENIKTTLLEVCFIDDADDMLIYENNRQAIYEAVSDGILEGFGLI